MAVEQAWAKFFEDELKTKAMNGNSSTTTYYANYFDDLTPDDLQDLVARKGVKFTAGRGLFCFWEAMAVVLPLAFLIVRVFALPPGATACVALACIIVAVASAQTLNGTFEWRVPEHTMPVEQAIPPLINGHIGDNGHTPAQSWGRFQRKLLRRSMVHTGSELGQIAKDARNKLWAKFSEDQLKTEAMKGKSSTTIHYTAYFLDSEKYFLDWTPDYLQHLAARKGVKFTAGRGLFCDWAAMAAVLPLAFLIVRVCALPPWATACVALACIIVLVALHSHALNGTFEWGVTNCAMPLKQAFPPEVAQTINGYIGDNNVHTGSELEQIAEDARNKLWAKFFEDELKTEARKGKTSITAYYRSHFHDLTLDDLQHLVARKGVKFTARRGLFCVWAAMAVVLSLALLIVRVCALPPGATACVALACIIVAAAYLGHSLEGTFERHDTR